MQETKGNYIKELEITNQRQAEELVFLREELSKLKAQQENSNVISTQTMELMEDPLYLEKILALMPGLIYWQDINGKVLGCNDEEARAFGFSSRYELIGKMVHDMFSKEDADILIENNKKIIEEGKLKIMEEVVVVDGKELTFISQKLPLKNISGKVIGILGISIDITERKDFEKKLVNAMEQVKIADKAKTEFLANMSHDIRTPFVGIIGIAEYLSTTEHDSERKKQLDILLDSSKQLLSLLNDVLEFSRVESGAIQIRKEKVDLKEALEQLYNLNQIQIKAKNIIFDYRIADNAPKKILIDRSRLQRVLLNLLSNAIKFTEEGSIHIEVGYSSKKKQLEISIKDTGVGIPKKYQRKIFEKFTRVTSSYHQTNYQGMGLGLFVVKRFVEEMEGKLLVESEENKGSTFRLYFPVEIVSEQECSEELVFQERLKRNAVTVLLVEDNSVAQWIAKQILTEFNCSVDIAKNLEEARSLLKSKQYNLILLDFGLPDGSGDTLIEDIQLSQEKPFVAALTANDSYDFPEKKSINHFISKPFTRAACNELLRKIEAFEII